MIRSEKAMTAVINPFFFVITHPDIVPDINEKVRSHVHTGVKSPTRFEQ